MKKAKKSMQSGSILLILLAAVSACGNHATQPLVSAMDSLTAATSSAPKASKDARSQLSPAMVGSLKQPLLLVSIPERGASATMTVFAMTKRVDDWRSADNTSLVLQDDIIVATRGLGADLFSAETDNVQSAVLDRGGRVMREHRFLDGENREAVETYYCTFESAGIENVDLIAQNTSAYKVIETCNPVVGNDDSFVNAYWIGVESPEILQSSQWISKQVGHVNIQHLKR